MDWDLLVKFGKTQMRGKKTQDLSQQNLIVFINKIHLFCLHDLSGEEAGFSSLLRAIIAFKTKNFARPITGDPKYYQKDLAYKANKPLDTITSFELWNYIHTPPTAFLRFYSVPSVFKTYTQEEVRVLPKTWAFVETTNYFLGKQLSPYWSIHSPKHKEYLKSINYNLSNCNIWMGQLYQNKVYLNIHAFQVTRYGVRIIYHIPILTNSFQTYNSDILDYKLVVQYNYDKSINDYNTSPKKGIPITGYIHDQPLDTIDTDTMKNIAPNTQYWGGGLVELTSYLNKFGTQPILLPGNYSVQPLQVLPIKFTKSDSSSLRQNYLNVTNARRGYSRASISEFMALSLTKLKGYKQQLSLDFNSLSTKINQDYRIFLNQI